MKLNKMIVLMGLTVLIAFQVSAVAGPSVDNPSGGFQGDLSSLRKRIIPVCAQFQAGKPSQSKDKLLSDIDSIVSNWKTMAAAYQNNPPAQYAKDPFWPGYFDEALDNFVIMRDKAAQGNYKRATQFCGLNCGLFVNMNQVSGIDKLSDKMFMLRKNAKLMMDMVKAGNWKGAAHMNKHNEEIVAVMPADVASAYDGFTKEIEKKDGAAAGKKFMEFMKIFGAAYSNYL